MSKNAPSWSAWIVRFLHILFVAWMVFAPFSNIDEFVLMHAIIAPFLILHWVTNSDACALTLLEKHLRGISHDGHSFIHSIVAPIYVIDDADLKTLVFGATLGLWSVSLQKVLKRTLNRET